MHSTKRYRKCAEELSTNTQPRTHKYKYYIHNNQPKTQVWALYTHICYVLYSLKSIEFNAKAAIISLNNSFRSYIFRILRSIVMINSCFEFDILNWFSNEKIYHFGKSARWFCLAYKPTNKQSKQQRKVFCVFFSFI